jgi:2'-hydroxyisoflavone reductase
MKLLVLGGTRFLGRHLVELALAQGHDVTLLHRGISNAGLFPQARHLIADRNADLSLLAKDEWHVAIDTNAYVPRHVRSMAAVLAKRVGVYQLVSSISAYASFDQPHQDETGALQTLADPTIEAVGGEHYGGLKALCEAAALEAFGKACLIARPGLIVGPYDPTGRFTWWVQRFCRDAAGGTSVGTLSGAVLAPGEPAAAVQFIDARDCAAWLLLQAERATTGTFNLTGPNTPLTMADLLRTTQTVVGSSADLCWVDEDFLLKQNVKPWTDLPLWLPRAEAGLHHTSIARALASGLQCRPLAQTVADTAAWATHELAKEGIGLSATREAELLRAWAQRLTGA